MFLRLAFFSLMVVGLFGFATVAWLSLQRDSTAVTARAVAQASVLATGRPLCAGMFVASHDVLSQPIDTKDAGIDAIIDTPEARLALVGASVRHCLAAGAAFAKPDIVRPGDRDFLATILAPGTHAVSVIVEALAGTSNLAWAGDHVDLILTQAIINPALPAGRRIAAETVARDVRILAIEQPVVRGAEPGSADIKARTVTLEVTALQAERVSVATRIGRLSLSIQSAQGPASLPSQATGRTTWASDVSPALGDDALPKPRDILRVFQGVADGKEFRF